MKNHQLDNGFKTSRRAERGSVTRSNVPIWGRLTAYCRRWSRRTLLRVTDARFAPCLILLLLALSPATIFAQENSAEPPTIEGIWKWTFTMPDGSQVTPRLELKTEAGQLTGSSRFRPGADAPVTNLTVQGSDISFEVARERDGRVVLTRYTGVWKGDTIKGKMTSNWSGGEQSYPWDAKRLTGVNGAWKWSSGFGGGPRFESRLTLKQEGEKLTGKINSGRGGESDIKRGRIKKGEVSFEVERERDGETQISRYYGKFSGNKIQGKSESNFFGQPRTNTWEALRAD